MSSKESLHSKNKNLYPGPGEQIKDQEKLPKMDEN